MDVAAVNECHLYRDSMSSPANPNQMIARGKYVASQFGPLSQHRGSVRSPIISGGMNALRLPAFFEGLGHSNVILAAGGGSDGHKEGPKIGAIACRQGEEAWKLWKAGQFGDISLSDGVIEYAKTHEEIIFFLLFPGIYCNKM